MPDVEIGLPSFVPLGGAVGGISLGGAHIAQLAYLSGTLGGLIGVDTVRLGDVPRLGVPFASMGAAGTFDGIFMTRIVAALLA